MLVLFAALGQGQNAISQNSGSFPVDGMKRRHCARCPKSKHDKKRKRMGEKNTNRSHQQYFTPSQSHNLGMQESMMMCHIKDGVVLAETAPEHAPDLAFIPPIAAGARRRVRLTREALANEGGVGLPLQV
jgi:hypothetical protein